MPIILRVKGYRIRFYEADLDEPVHVHIEKENKAAKYWPIVPIVVPDLREVRQFAHQLHKSGKVWAGEFQGWQAEYYPEQAEPPLDSRMTFTPAEFCIGESDIWFFSMMWEHGSDQPPVEFLNDANILALAA